MSPHIGSSPTYVARAASRSPVARKEAPVCPAGIVQASGTVTRIQNGLCSANGLPVEHREERCYCCESVLRPHFIFQFSSIPSLRSHYFARNSSANISLMLSFWSMGNKSNLDFKPKTSHSVWGPGNRIDLKVFIENNEIGLVDHHEESWQRFMKL